MPNEKQILAKTFYLPIRNSIISATDSHWQNDLDHVLDEEKKKK